MAPNRKPSAFSQTVVDIGNFGQRLEETQQQTCDMERKEDERGIESEPSPGIRPLDCRSRNLMKGISGAVDGHGGATPTSPTLGSA